MWGDLEAQTERLNDSGNIRSHVIAKASTVAEAKVLLREGDNCRVSLRKNGVSDSLIMVRNRGLNGRMGEFLSQVGDGSIIRRFDKTKNPVESSDVVCPHFLEFKWAYGCPWNCSWCYLKGTLRFQKTKTQPVSKDITKVRRHLSSFLKGWKRKELLNSGEICDSLMFEHNGFALSESILPLMKSQNLHKMLIVTKSIEIENLLKNDFTEETVVSFSLNSEPVAKKWEKAPSVTERIKAAKRLDEAGYTIRIRIDPMVPITRWASHYVGLIDKIFEGFQPERLTIGSLRGLQSTINHCPDKSWVSHLQESSSWGRKISFRKRFQMYSCVQRYLSKTYGYDKTSLCKETLGMWKELGMDYQNMECNCLL